MWYNSYKVKKMLKAMFGWFIGCIIGVILANLLNMSIEVGEIGLSLITLCALAGVCLGVIWYDKEKQK